MSRIGISGLRTSLLLSAGLIGLWSGAAQATSVFGVDMTTNGNANVVDPATLQIIPDDLGAGNQGGPAQLGSAYVSSPVAVSNSTQFTATFSFLLSNSDANQNGLGLADGFTFVIQSTGVNALGDAGSNIGYATGGGNAAVSPSLAVAFRTFSTNDVEIDQNGNLGGPAQSLNLQGGQYGVQDTGSVTVTYNGAGTLLVTGSDSGGDTINLSETGIDLSGLGGAAFVGFTGASASGSADEEITAFSLDVTNTVPEPATFALFAMGLVGLGSIRRRRAAAIA